MRSVVPGRGQTAEYAARPAEWPAQPLLSAWVRASKPARGGRLRCGQAGAEPGRFGRCFVIEGLEVTQARPQIASA
jgi:hypothetical protein